MLGRVREAIFNRLAPWTDGALVLDLFSGTGSLGLEALSRGAKFARFLERGPDARAALKSNLAAFEFVEQSEARNGDALNSANHVALKEGRWDIVFFDPPYPMLDSREGRDGLIECARAIIAEQMAEDGVFVFHTPSSALSARDFGEGIEAALSSWGTTDIWFLGRAEDDE